MTLEWLVKYHMSQMGHIYGAFALVNLLENLNRMFSCQIALIKKAEILYMRDIWRVIEECIW